MAVAHFFDSLTLDKLKTAYDKKGYTFFENGDYNLNIFGIRNEKDRDANTFNDIVGIAYKVNGKWVLKKYEATTDPGLYWRNNLCNVYGTGILVPNQYKGGWRIGMHQGKYRALVQNKPVQVYRDKNKDSKLDMDTKTIQTGMFGVNIHRANPNPGFRSQYVCKWSAACQVLSSADDFQEFMSIVDKSAKIFGNEVFTYTLFKESEVF